MINQKYISFLRNIDDFELLSGVNKSIKKINVSGYLAIVITNQPVIAMEEVNSAQLDEIHNEMKTLLRKEDAYLDSIYFCPHHPNRWYEGEIQELKFDCDCHKSKPRLLIKAAEDFNIDLLKPWMLDVGKSDVLMGNAVGCQTVLQFNEHCDTMTYTNLFETVKLILKERLWIESKI